MYSSSTSGLRCLALCLLACSLISGSCALFGRGEKLPPEPGLLAEDFGTGMVIGMEMEAAKSRAKAGPPLTVEVLTPEALMNRDPYNNEGELLLAVCPQPARGPITVEELRCYTRADTASLTFNGGKLALLSVSAAEQQLGKPVSTTASSDGKTHILYYFSIAGDRARRLRLTLSFDHLDHCFALELQRESSRSSE